MKEVYVFSIDEIQFIEIDEFLDYIDELDNIEYVYMALKKPYMHKDFIDANDIIEEVCNRAYEIVDDISDVYISCVEEKKHQVELQKIIEEYFNKNINQPDFFSCENIKKISYQEFLKMDNN